MTFRTAIIILLIISSGINIRTAYLTLRKKLIAGYKPFSLMMIAIAVYALGYALELSSSTLERIFFSLKIEYLGIVCFPAFWVLMALQSTGVFHIPRKRLVISLFIIPVLTLAVLYTNNIHQLYYRNFAMNPDSPFPMVMFDKGPLYYGAVAYMYACILSSNIIFIRFLRGSSQPFRKQALVVVIVSFVPWLLTIIYQIGLIPYNLDPGSIGMSIAGLLMGYAISRLKTFRITPIARKLVFKDMADPVLVLNNEGYLTDFNLAAGKLFPSLNVRLIGTKIGTIPDIPDQLTNYATSEMIEPEMITLTRKEKAFYFQVRKTKVFSKPSRVDGIILTITELTARVELQKQLEELATRDGLTHVFNRRHFMVLAENEIIRSFRYRKHSSLIMLDIDHFKRVNDTLGHQTGDHVLVSIAECLDHNLRTFDILGRYGGEEFIIFLPETDMDTAVNIAERLCVSLSKLKLDSGGVSLSITASFGVSGCYPESNHKSLDTIITSADSALYRAKNSGRNRVESDRSLTD